MIARPLIVIGAAMWLAGAATADVVLRGGRVVDAPIVSIGPQGVELGGDKPSMLSWDRIKLVRGERASEADPYLELAEDLWRARTRLERGDVALAEPVFESAFESMRGKTGATSLLAAEGLLRCRLARGATAAALDPWLDAFRQRRAGARASWDGPPALDERLHLSPLLPPIYEDDATARAVVDRPVRATGDAAADAADALHRCAALAALGEGDAPPDLSAEALADETVAFLRSLVLAQCGEERERRSARESLERTLTNDLGSWREPWRRVAIGRAMLLEEDEPERRRGVLHLLHAAARFRGSQPALASIALGDAASALGSLGETGEAASLDRLAQAEPAPAAARGGGVFTPARPDGAEEADDALERFLESASQASSLIALLEQRAETAGGDRRRDLVERLASLYADSLASEPSAAERAEIERRARRLLDAEPDAEFFELRLNLHRAAYSAAEAVAERHRVRLADPAEVEQAQRSLRALAQDLERLALAAHRRVEGLEKQEESARDIDTDLVARSLAAARQHRSMGFYLAAWSNVYLAELIGEPSFARRALEQFGWLLNAEPGKPPTIERLPVQTLEYEHVARAAIGVAASLSIMGDAAGALAWLDVLEQFDELAEAPREQLFARRMIVLATDRRWAELVRLVSGKRGVDERGRLEFGREFTPLAPTEARLLAVAAFEAEAPAHLEALVRSLRRTAIDDLVARDQLPAVLDLAGAYGPDAIGGQGFIVDYVRGLLAFREARDLHGEADSDRPSADPAVVAAYERAAELLALALRNGDANRFAEARADAALLLGLSWYSSAGGQDRSDRLFDAAATLQEAAGLATAPEAKAEALWMAIRALDEARRRPIARAEEAARRRDGLIADFVRAFPNDARAARALIQQSADGSLATREAIDALLAVGEDSPAHDEARREAARRLYAMMREAPKEERPALAARFLDVAQPLLERDLFATATDDPGAGERAVLLARQIMDAGLGDPPPDARAAQNALTILRLLDARGAVSIGGLEDEIRWRELQIAAALEDSTTLARIAEALLSGPAPAESAFDRAAESLLLQRAYGAWRDGARTEVGARSLVRLAGRRLLADDVGEREALLLRLAIGEAADWLWMQTGDEAARDLALGVLRTAREAEPDSAPALRLLAEVSARAGDAQTALDCWRRLLAGSDAGSEAWFEARLRVIELVAADDPDAARALLAQHRAVYPDDGPPPWGERFRSLRVRLGQGDAAR